MISQRAVGLSPTVVYSIVWYVYVCVSCHSIVYTRSPLEDSRLFGPSPWKILRHYL